MDQIGRYIQLCQTMFRVFLVVAAASLALAVFFWIRYDIRHIAGLLFDRTAGRMAVKRAGKPTERTVGETVGKAVRKTTGKGAAGAEKFRFEVTREYLVTYEREEEKHGDEKSCTKGETKR